MEDLEFVYKTADGSPLLASVIYGSSKSGVSRPIVLYAHGGTFTIGSKELLPIPQRQILLDLGFVIVSPNYRLSPTISAVDGAVTDVRDCYVWVKKHLPALLQSKAGINLDPSKIVAFGHSCGGTLALLLAAEPEPPLAIADFFGMKYLDDPFYHSPLPALAQLPSFDENVLNQIHNDIPPPSTTPPPIGPSGPDFTQYRVAWLFDAMKKGTYMPAIIPGRQQKLLDPVFLFNEKFPPTIFVHGSEDTTVDVKFSREAFSALRQKGVESRLVIVEGGEHGFDVMAVPGDKNFGPVIEAFEFLRQHV